MLAHIVSLMADSRAKFGCSLKVELYILVYKRQFTRLGLSAISTRGIDEDLLAQAW